MKKTIFIAGLLLAALGFLVGCQGGGDTPEEGGKEKITIAEMRGEFWLPVYIAEVNGYYEEEGLEAEFVVYKDGPIALQSMHAGDADFCMLSTEPVLRAYEEGFESEIIMATLKNKAFMFAAGEGVTDLKGQAIFGGTPGSSPYSFVSSYLKEQGLDPDNDVNWVNMEYGAALNALESKQLAAAYFDSTRRTAVEGINAAILIDTTNPEDHKAVYGTEFYESSIIATTKEFSETHPETVQKFVNAVQKAMKWQQEKSDAEIVSAIAPMFEGDAVNEDVIKILKSSLSKDGTITEEGYAAIEKFSLDQGIIKEPLDYDVVINMDYVNNGTK